MHNPIDRMRDMSAWLNSRGHITQAEEMEEYARLMEIYSKIFSHAFAADKVGNIYFICGEGGEKDKNNLPKQIHICPAYGCDWFQIYERTDKTFGPEW